MREEARTGVPDGAPDGVASREEELHKPGGDEASGTGDAHGLAAAGEGGEVTRHPFFSVRRRDQQNPEEAYRALC